MRWKPHITVATVVEKNDKFLMVEEEIDGQIVINQPAGHFEKNESIIEAVIRETKEETGWNFEPTAMTGIYQWHHQQKEITFLRFAFSGNLIEHDPEYIIDSDISRVTWMSFDEIQQNKNQHRSPMVMQCIHDYKKLPHSRLDLLKNIN